jgi:hypothetical protein
MSYLDKIEDTASPGTIIEMLVEYVRNEFGSAEHSTLIDKDIFTSEPDKDHIITNILEHIDELNKKNGVTEVFVHIETGVPALYGNEFSLPCTHTRLPSEIINSLPLKHACKIGTWGRYRVLEKDCIVIPEKNEKPSDDILLILVHCNISNIPLRLKNIENAKMAYGKLLHSVGIKNILYFSANEFSTLHDLQYAKKLHPHHEHWNPHYIASIMKRMYNKYPKSIILTHRYIGSLLLDNNFFFKMHFLIDIDNVYTLKRCFSDIYRHLQQQNHKL